jgi:hypothetical protein
VAQAQAVCKATYQLDNSQVLEKETEPAKRKNNNENQKITGK